MTLLQFAKNKIITTTLAAVPAKSTKNRFNRHRNDHFHFGSKYSIEYIIRTCTLCVSVHAALSQSVNDLYLNQNNRWIVSSLFVFFISLFYSQQNPSKIVWFFFVLLCFCSIHWNYNKWKIATTHSAVWLL